MLKCVASFCIYFIDAKMTETQPSRTNFATEQTAGFIEVSNPNGDYTIFVVTSFYDIYFVYMQNTIIINNFSKFLSFSKLKTKPQNVMDSRRLYRLSGTICLMKQFANLS